MKPTLLMMRGLPASGKTTFAKSLAETGRYKRVNKDDLRAMLDAGRWSKANEARVVQVRDWIAKTLLEDGFNVIVDDTNFHPKHEAVLRVIADHCNADFEVKTLDVDVYECIERDAKRPNGVGKDVIWDMWKQSVIPKVEWPADRESKPQVVICDLDGTIANMKHRSPYDASTCEQDELYKDVWAVLRSLNLPIIFCSGREEKYVEPTLKWIKEKCIGFDKLHYPLMSTEYRWLNMRATGDSRKDWLIKYEILRDHIAPNFNPVAVFDDRDQVVAMWRAQGLRCFQVADGNF